MPGNQCVAPAGQILENESAGGIGDCKVAGGQYEDDSGHPVVDVAADLDRADLSKTTGAAASPLYNGSSNVLVGEKE